MDLVGALGLWGFGVLGFFGVWGFWEFGGVLGVWGFGGLGFRGSRSGDLFPTGCSATVLKCSLAILSGI